MWGFGFYFVAFILLKCVAFRFSRIIFYLLIFDITFGIVVAFLLASKFLIKDENVTVIVVRRKRYASSSNRT